LSDEEANAGTTVAFESFQKSKKKKIPPKGEN